MTLKEMSKNFGNIYNIEGSDILIGKSNGIWGWELIKDKKNEISWIRVDEYESIWAPYNEYYEEDSEENN